MKIVITGTTSGIGKALALYYAQPGVILDPAKVRSVGGYCLSRRFSGPPWLNNVYAATKAAVRALMEGYGWELRRHGIATTTINPGFVVSEMTAHNQFRMPFLVPTDIAAAKIAQAIQRRRRSYTFPWPMACLAHLLPFIPGVILRRLTPPGRPSSV
jgi:short-subunit dehydrogenase